MLEHDRAIAEFRDETVATLDGWKAVSEHSRLRGHHILAYETSATLSLLKRFLRREISNPSRLWPMDGHLPTLTGTIMHELEVVQHAFQDDFKLLD